MRERAPTRAGALLAGALRILALDLAGALLELAGGGHALDGVVRVRLQPQAHLAEAALLSLCVPHLQE